MSRHVPRIYSETPLATGQRLSLPEGRAHHLLNVLRLKPGAAIFLIDGRGGEYEATLVEAGKNWVGVEIGAHHAIVRESPLSITLAQGASRGERMDYTIQKSVELGVSFIQPLDTEYSQLRLDAARGAKKLAHWREIARSAAEQSGRERVPQIAASLPLAAWLATSPDSALKLLLDPDTSRGLNEHARNTDICLLVGPEAGFSTAEIEAAQRAGFAPMRLGPRILRTETAGPVALAVIQAQWGDLLR